MIKTKDLQAAMQLRPHVTSDQYVCQQVCGEYKHLPIEGRVVMDLGANIGAFNVYATMKNAASVISYEPDPENFRQLFINAGDNSNLNQAAVVATNQQTVDFYLTTGKARDGFSVIPFKGRTPITVRAVNFHQQLQLYKPQSVKMDVEGAEFMLLQEPLPDFVTDIVVEIHFSKRIFRDMYLPLISKFKDWRCVIEPKCTDKNFHTLAQYSRT